MNFTTQRYSALKDRRKLLYIGVGVLIFVALIFIFGRGGKNTSNSQTLGTVTNSTTTDNGSKKTLNREFSFPIKDDRGRELTQIKYTILDAQLQDQIIVKGQRVNAVEGKTFLIIKLKLRNDYSSGIRINTRDYLRLTAGNKDEKLAADIHNDPVLVQAISTKYTQMGFPINKSDKDLILTVGEINGPKQTINLSFK